MEEKNEKLKRLVENLIEDYRDHSEVVMGEQLASTDVSAASAAYGIEISFEDAVNVYATLMRWAEGDEIMHLTPKKDMGYDGTTMGIKDFGR